MRATSGNLLEQLPGNPDEEVFEQLLESGQVRVERIVSKGHTSPPGFWYDQAQNEWVVVLKGAATVNVEGEGDHHLIPGSYLNLPAHTRHRVEWTDPDTETIWLAVHYPTTA
jgi:cupin 2 domain-containing protein